MRPGAGCGCAYPLDVSDAEVSRSNRILERLRDTARAFPQIREHAGRAAHEPRGDAWATRAWASCMAMQPRSRAGASRTTGWTSPGTGAGSGIAFRDSGVDVFASSHTCLPAMRTFDFGAGEVAVANNGAAGMPNFAGTRLGHPHAHRHRNPSGCAALYGRKCAACTWRRSRSPTTAPAGRGVSSRAGPRARPRTSRTGAGSPKGRDSSSESALPHAAVARREPR